MRELPSEARFSAVYLITKATELDAAVQAALPRLEDDAYFVTFQNGYVEDIVAARAGAARVISSVVGLHGTMRAPGQYERTSAGQWILGESDGRITPRLTALAEVLELVAEARISRNIRGALWAKLCLNCSVTALGALGGAPLASVVAGGASKAAFFETIREVVAVADAAGIQLEKLAIEPALFKLPHGADWLDSSAVSRLRDLLLEYYGTSKPSILQSLERKRLTEIDQISGYVARVGTALGVPTPFNTAVTRMIHEIERGERGISPDNLRELSRAG